MTDRELIAELADLSQCMDDLDAWATCGPEGFTKDEKRRVREYGRGLDKANRRLAKAA